MAIYPREDPRTVLPQLEKRIRELEELVAELKNRIEELENNS